MGGGGQARAEEKDDAADSVRYRGDIEVCV